MKEDLRVVSVTQNGKDIPFKIDGNQVSFSADEHMGTITVTYETTEKQDFEPSNSNSDLEPVASHSCASSNSIEQYLTNRIERLREADAAFCEWRWGSDPIKKLFGREESNKVTFARQELESVLELLNSDKNPERSVATEVKSMNEPMATNYKGNPLRTDTIVSFSTEADKQKIFDAQNKKQCGDKNWDDHDFEPLQNSPVKEDWKEGFTERMKNLLAMYVPDGEPVLIYKAINWIETNIINNNL